MDGEANRRVVNVLKQEYDFDRHKVTFKDVTPADVSQALKSKGIGAAFICSAGDRKISCVGARAFSENRKKNAIADCDQIRWRDRKRFRCLRGYDLPKGTLWGSPPIPDDDLTTLRVPFYLVANKKLNDDNVADLTTRHHGRTTGACCRISVALADWRAEHRQGRVHPLFIPARAAYYGDTEQSFFDKYSNQLYYGPMVFGALMSGLIAAWKFLGFGSFGGNANPLDALYALGRRIRAAPSEAELGDIEGEIDEILKSGNCQRAGGDETAVDPCTLSLMAHRLEVSDPLPPDGARVGCRDPVRECVRRHTRSVTTR